ncbi:MAG: permease [Candidatus Aenigmarchaeota archaeon]|nr:permease [Candidatus Aenigmarchaeota archaeon]
MIDVVLKVLFAGVYALIDYLGSHVLMCLVPAFFIAGAMSALLPKEKITKYLGRNVPKYKAYPLAVVAGLLLAVCSCTILPLFAGIKKKGAGIGPAIAFLYTAPATNILAIVLTGSVLGWDFAASRIILSVTFAIIIGIIISKMFTEKDGEDKRLVKKFMKEQKKTDGIGRSKKGTIQKFKDGIIHYHLLIFFATLIAILIIGASKIETIVKSVSLIGLILLLLVQLKISFKKEEIKSWLNETWMFFKLIFPLLLVGIFIAGVLTSLIPENFLADYVGSNTIFANLAAALFGVFMYFPTLVEVPMAKMFLGLGMAKGPLLAYLLADPVISLPSILVVRKIMGTKRTLVYALLIIIFCTLSGLIYGMFVG